MQHLIYPRTFTGFECWSSSQTYGILWRSYGISRQIFGLVSSFLSNRLLRVVLEYNLSQEYSVNDEFLKAPFLVLHFSYYTSVTFLMMLPVVLLSMAIILLSTQCDLAPDLCQQKILLLNLNLIYATLDWDKKWLVDFNAAKNHLVSLDRSNNTGATEMKNA